MKLGLGSVQFGLAYGISNAAAKPHQAEIDRILQCAERGGVEYIDTAQSYGDSEEVLGRLDVANRGFQLGTKFFVPDHYKFGDISKAVTRSLDRLRCRELSVLSFHESDIASSKNLHIMLRELNALCESGAIGAIGVSVYTEKELQDILRVFTPSVVQMPCSVFDQRFHTGGWISYLQSKGVKVHLRSVFLQGLLLMDGISLPTNLRPYAKNVQKFVDFCSHSGVTQLEATLDFVASTGADLALVGANNADEITAVLSIWAGSRLNLDYSELAQWDENLIIPAKWK